MSDQEVVLRITGKNESQPATEQAREGLRALNAEADKTSAKTKDATQSTDVFAASWRTAALGAVAAGAAGLATLTLQAMSSANHLTDLRTKTGLSLEELQRLDYVARLTGQGVDVYANAVYRMGINVEKGGEQTQAAVERMGMSWEDFRALSPEKQLQAIVQHLNFTSDAQERNATLAAIFGRSIDNVLVGLVQHYGAAGQSATIMSDEAVEALAKYDARLQKFKADWSQWMTAQIGQTLLNVDAVSSLTDAEQKRIWQLTMSGKEATEALRLVLAQREAASALTDEHRKYIAAIYETQGAQVVLSQEFQNSGKFIGVSRDQVLAYAQSLIEKTAPAQRDYIAELRDAKAALADLTPAERAQLAAATASTESTKQLAAAFGLSEVAVKIFKDQLRESEAEQKKAAEAARKYQEVLDRIAASTADVTAEDRARILELKAKHHAESDIAVALRVTAAQVKQVVADEKQRVEALEASDQVLAEIEARRLKDAAQQREEAQKAGLARLKMETDLNEVLTRFHQEQSVRGLQGLERELAAIQISEETAIAAARRTYGTNVDLAEQEIAVIRTKHQHMRGLAIGTADTVIERAVAQGFATTKMLRESADTAKRTYDEMRASGEFNLEELERARQKWLEAERRAAQDFVTNWSEVFGGALSITRAFGRELIAIGEATGNDSLKGLGSKISTMATITQQGMSSIEKFAAGDWVGGAIDGIGAIGGAIAAVFGKSQGRKDLEEANKEIDTLRSQLVGPGGAYPSMRDLDAAAARVGMTMSDTFGNQGKKGLEAVNARIAEFESRLARVDAAMSKYNIQWHELGEAARAAKLRELIEELVEEQEALTWAGLSSEDALKKQAKAYNDLLTQAMRTGQALPPALLPTVLRLAEMGELTETNTRLLLGMAEDTRPGLKELEDAASILGIKVSDLGTRYDQLKFDDATDRYMKAFETLAAGGMGVHEAISKMSDETIEAIAAGVRLGREFPEGMRPVLQAMLEQGRLTDENGEKLTSLSGVSFAESLTAKMGSVIDVIHELIAAIRGVPEAMNQIPRSLDVDVNFRASRHGEWYEGGGDGVVVEPFASGGVAEGPMYAQIEPGRKEIIGDVSFMTTALTGALERLGRGGMSAGVGAAGAPQVIHLHLEMGGVEFDERVVRVGEAALQGGRWQVPQDSISRRAR